MTEVADPTSGIPVGQTNLWLARALAREEGAWDRLHARFVPRLLGYAELKLGRKLRTRTTAADLVSETWRRALQGFEAGFRSEGTGSFYRWLTKLCRQVAWDEARRLQARPDARSLAAGSAVDVYGLRADATLPPERALELEEDVSLMVSGLRMLGCRERWLLVTFYIEHRTAESLAARVRCTESTLMKQIYRARERLREIVQRAVFGTT